MGVWRLTPPVPTELYEAPADRQAGLSPARLAGGRNLALGQVGFESGKGRAPDPRHSVTLVVAIDVGGQAELAGGETEAGDQVTQWRS